jgi:hypothetical protein
VGSGPKLQGKIRPIGGDWFTLRTDGVGILGMRATFELDEGALVYITFTGAGDLGADGYERFLRGARYPTDYLPLGGNTSQQALREEGYPLCRW